MKKKKRKIWLWVLLSLVTVLLLSVGSVFALIHSKINKMEKVKIDKSDLGIQKEHKKIYDSKKDIKNIALFGIDAEDGEAGRSDAIMIATIDGEHNKLKLTSIMRDSYVNIEGHGMDKINHAFAFGGAQLAVKTLNQNFGLNIENFLTVNFSSLPKIIDLLGGVDINITDEEAAFVDGIDGAGTYTLTGDQALTYSRIRYAAGGDYKRTERQRTVLEALFAKASSMPKSSALNLTDALLPYVQTNMSATDILSLGTSVLSAHSNGLEQLRFPLDGYSEGKMIDEVYYLTFDADTTKKQIMDYIFEDKQPQ